ncbi:MAG: ABC transporter permease, partial [Promicromonosporaceae bacterium]|nr:ABC transporter permease [Promicromonosporaceae bacterium]
MTQTTTAALAARYANADLIVRQFTTGITAAEVQEMRQIPGVQAADLMAMTHGEFASGGRSVFQMIMPVASDPRLDPFELVTGTLPSQGGEVALPVDLANRLGLAVGDTVDLTLFNNFVTEDLESSADVSTDRHVELTVTGTLSDQFGAYADWGGAAVVSEADFATWSAGTAGTLLTAGEALVALDAAGLANETTVRSELA